MTPYVNWLAKITLPADDHKLVRPVHLFAPDDEVDFLRTVLPRLNPDMEVVEYRKFDNQAEFEAAVAAANTEAAKQVGWKSPGKYDMQLSQAQVDKIRGDREAALAELRPKSQAVANA